MNQVIFFIIFGALAHSATPTAHELLDKLDRLYRADSSQATLEMTIQTKNWTRTLKLESWSRGMDETLIRILSPKKDVGIATLRKKKDIWNFFPKINKTIKVPPTMMMSSWMGSDFTNDDLVRESSYIKDYDFKMADASDHYTITLTPKEKTITVWSRAEVDIDKKTEIPSAQRFYNERGEIVQTLTFSKIKTISGRTVPMVMEMIPHGKESQKTRIEYLDIQFNPKLRSNQFSLQMLKQTR